ncbi:MAG: sodium:solute symporter [Bacteroidia bacterium]|nr:sodium:solute symporter [Bacteroidia bacterium]MBT8276674.1 sodium:solute symporter [Bacteroidia bacterium]NNF32211.1 sodium/solute symporter [Flavobacteriaceae bacterium]NNK55132.1 sodium/solute symporter [Flavobacteriaceae bacterium]NNM08466.1 sodium/solute symporter [Flavobacteriaceae bacterium]
MGTLEILDYVVIGGYFVLVFAIAWYVTTKEKSGENSANYFLGGRNLGWFAIGASLFASNIGSEHLIGLSGAGARGAFPEAQFEILAALILLLLGWVFVPFYIKSGVFTMPEFLERRYNKGSRTYLSLISIISYVLTKISFTIFAGALVFEVLLGIPFWTGAIITVVATGIYTVFGGLKAVIYTDMVQSIIFILGGICATYFGLEAIGGWDNVLQAIQDNAPEPDTFMSLWRNKEYPWTGVLLGAPILGVWYWCTDQFIVQRVLSAKNIKVAKQGTIFGGFLKLLPLFIFVVPGIIAYALSVTEFPDLFTITNPITGETKTTTDAALPALILHVMPIGIKGLVVAGFLAALMSSLSSVFNSTSTLFTFDFYKEWRPKASERELVNIGRLATVILVIVGLAWIPFMQKLTEGGGIYKYLQSVQAYISPPIAAAFLLGIFYKKINGRGALTALWVGFVLGIGRLVLEFMSQEGGLVLSDSSLLGTLVTMNFLHYAIFLFVISICVMVLVSLATQSTSKELDPALTYDYGERKATMFRTKEFVLTMIIIVCVLILWYVFR